MTRSRSTIAALVALMLALLLAQWNGLHHRIAHASLMAGGQPASLALAPDTLVADHGHDHADAGADTSPDLFHSCLLLDAAALAATLHNAFFTLLSLHLPAVRGKPASPPVWQACFVPHFSPRAPPSN